MERKFFNILDLQIFSDKSESEQKALLIESNIYKKGKSINVDISIEEGEIWRGSSNYTQRILYSIIKIKRLPKSQNSRPSRNY